MIFGGADTSALQPDARFTAVVLWTLADSHRTQASARCSTETDSDDHDEHETSALKREYFAESSVYAVEYDAARKIAQGLGINLDDLYRVVKLDRKAKSGASCRLLTMAERTKLLFDQSIETTRDKVLRATDPQQATQRVGHENHPEWGGIGKPLESVTTLDRVHQAMLIFGMRGGDAMMRLLVEYGVGKDTEFWVLAQSLSALYPAGSDEKRWIDGVMYRKRAFGFE